MNHYLPKDQKKIFEENDLDEKLSFNTNDDLLVLHYTVAGYSTGK